MKKLTLFLSILICSCTFVNAQVVTTVAGSTTNPGFTDGTGTAAALYIPSGIVYDGSGNIFISEGFNIRQMVISSGIVTTLAGSKTYGSGSTDATGTAATFSGSTAGIAYDGSGNLFVADQGNNEIREISTASGAVTTLAGTTTSGSADGTGTAAGFSHPAGIAYDGSGNLYIADEYNYEIRKVVIATGAVTTFAGSTVAGSTDGTGTAAKFTYPSGIVYDGNGNLYVSEIYGNRIRKIVIATAAVTTVAGSGSSGSIDGIGVAAQFNQPNGMVYDGNGNLFVADQANNEIRLIALATGSVTTFAGATTPGSADGTGNAASFSSPYGVVMDGGGNIFVADGSNYEIRKISILPKPVAAFTVISTTACAGTALQFADNSTNSPSSWNWSFQDGTNIITSTSQNPLVTFHTPGTDSVKLVVSSYSGKDSLTKKLYITVNAAPNVSIDENVIGGGLICGLYDTLAAKATGFGSLTYSWSNTGTYDTIMVGGPAKSYLGNVITWAGSSLTPGSADGTGTSASFNAPIDIVYDGNGNIYVTDALNNEIRKIVIATGVVTTLAGSTSSGSADGTGVAAKFNGPNGIAYDGNGNLYVVDRYNNEIRKIVIATGAVTTLAGTTSPGSADGTGTAAAFNNPAGVVCDGSGNLYVADQANYEIRKIVIASGAVTTFAGLTLNPGEMDGSGTAAGFTYPTGIAYDGNGNLYVTDFYGNDVRKIVIAGANVTTIVGSNTPGAADGIGTAAQFNQPAGLKYDGFGNLYVCDKQNNEIRRITLVNNNVTTFAGSTTSGTTDGIGAAAGFNNLTGLAFDASGNLYVADVSNYEIRKIAVPNFYSVTVTDGHGCKTNVSASAAVNHSPLVTIAANKGAFCTGMADTLVANATGTGPFGYSWSPSSTGDTDIVLQNNTYSVTVTDGNGCITTVNKTITTNTLPVVNVSENVIGGSLVCGLHDTITAKATGNGSFLYNWSTTGTRDTIIVSGPPAPALGIVTTLAGTTTPGYADGTGTAASFYSPAGIVSDGLGSLYVTDNAGINEVRKISIATGVVTTLAGSSSNASGSSDGIGTAASFNGPTGIAYDGNGNLYIADQQNNEIRKIVIATGAVTTVAGTTTSGSADGTGTAASFYSPTGIAYDGSGNLYIVDHYNNEIRKMVIATGVVTTFAGSTSGGSADGIGTAASFNAPAGIAYDGQGNLYVTDQNSDEIRKIVISTAAVTTFAGQLYNAGALNGTGTTAEFNQPSGIVYDGFGDLYVSELQNNDIRKIVVATGAVSTIAGSITSGSSNGTGMAASFTSPNGLAFDQSGNMYVADQGNYEVRKIKIPNFYSVTVTDKNGCKTTASASALVYPAAKVTISSSPACIGIADTLIAHGTGTGPFVYNWSTSTTGDTNIITTDNTYSVTAIDSVGCSAAGSKNITMNTTPVVTVSGNVAGLALACGLHDTLTAKATGNGSFIYNWNTSGTNDTILVSGPPAAPAGIVTTLAGSTSGSANGTGTAAKFNGLGGVTSDGNGNLYIADSYNSEIRKVVTATGIVTTIAGSLTPGSADGTGTAASFSDPEGIAYDGNGNLYVADAQNNEIRKLVIATGAVTTFVGSTASGSADGIGTAASFSYPVGIAYYGGNLYVADRNNSEIRKIVLTTGAVTTFAGSTTPGIADGTGIAAAFNYPNGITVDGKGNLYLTDGTSTIRKIVIATAVVTTLAGSNVYGAGDVDGTGTNAQFNAPQGIISDGLGFLYVADEGNNEIRKINIASTVVSTIAGSSAAGSSDGTGATASFNAPAGMSLSNDGNLYIADRTNNRLRKMHIPNFYSVTVTDKNGCKTIASANALVYPAATVSLKLLQSVGAKCVALADTIIATATGTGVLSYNWSPSGSGDTNIVVNNATYTLTITDSAGCVASASKKIIISGPPQIVINPTSLNGNALCFGLKDSLMANVSGVGPFNYLWSNSATTDSTVVLPTVAVNGGIVTTFAGALAGGITDGTGTAARFAGPAGMVSDGNGNIYIADQSTGAIRKMVVSSAVVTTVAGGQLGVGSADGTGTAATFNQPTGIAYDGQGNLYVSDGANNEIRKIVIATAVVTTFAGSTTAGSADGIGTAASFHSPHGLAYDGKGNLYVADQLNNEIRKIVLSTGAVTTVAGSTTSGYNNGIGTAAQFNNPYGIVCDSRGNLYITDTYNHEIRKMIPATGVVSSYAGSIYNGASTDGTGTAASFALLNGITTDVYGNMYVTDLDEVRKIVIATGVVTTMAGSVNQGSADGVAQDASFVQPEGVAVGEDDNVYVADKYNNEIRKIVKANTYYITVSDVNGCKDSASISVGIRTLKIVGNITGGGTAVCAGIVDTLKAVSSATGAFIYSWNNSATTDTIKVSSTGTYSVTAVDGFGCVDTASIKVVVNPLPVINITMDVIGGANICVGMKDTLTAHVTDPSPSLGYAWYKNGSGISDYKDTITVTTSATYSVFVSDGNGCYATAAQVITVNALPVVSVLGNTIGDTTICSGLVDTLKAHVIGNAPYKYVWSNAATKDTILVTTANTYSVNVTDKYGCKGSASAKITVNPTPTVTITGSDSVRVGKNDTLTASGATSYIWSTGSTSDTAIIKQSGSATYYVLGIGTGGCKDSASFKVFINVVGIDAISNSTSTTLYPNPAIRDVNLSFEMPVGTKDAVIKIIDASGKEVMSENETISNGKALKLNIGTLAQGLYFVKVITANESQVVKFIKQ